MNDAVSSCSSLLRGTMPRVVGTARRLDTLRSDPRKLRRQCDIVEVRLDLIGPDAPGWADLCGAIEAAGIPVIVTLRAAAEGGAWSGPETRRAEILGAALERCSAIDIELAGDLRADLCRRAQGKGRTAVVSHHDFSATPAADALAAVVRRARVNPACIPKLATMVRTAADSAALLALLRAERGAGPLCVIGMGDAGSETRYTLAVAGSCLAYGFLDEPVAPGQLPAGTLKKEIAARLPTVVGTG